jgi:hypothetical protein
MASARINGLRTKARVFAPEAFDPGQVVEFDGKRGVVWSLGCDVGRSTDSRWVVVEDGGVELLVLYKDGSGKAQTLRAAGWTSWARYVPTNAAPFSVAEFASEFAQEEMELAA